MKNKETQIFKIFDEQEFYKIASDILSNRDYTKRDLLKVIFYKVEQSEKYYDVVGAALLKLGLESGKNLAKDFSKVFDIKEFEIVNKITEKISSTKKDSIEIDKKDFDTLENALLLYNSILHIIFREEIQKQIGCLVEKLTEKIEKDGGLNDL